MWSDFVQSTTEIFLKIRTVTNGGGWWGAWERIYGELKASSGLTTRSRPPTRAVSDCPRLIRPYQSIDLTSDLASSGRRLLRVRSCCPREQRLTVPILRLDVGLDFEQLPDDGFVSALSCAATRHGNQLHSGDGPPENEKRNKNVHD